MKFKITEQQKSELQDFLDQFLKEIAQLEETANRVSKASASLNETEKELGSLNSNSIESLADKDIQRRVVLIEKKRMLGTFVPELELSSGQQKQLVVKLSREATELFRTTARQREVEAKTRAKFNASLPDTLQNDEYVALSAWSRSQLLRELTSFFNPAIDPHDPAGEIAQEARTRALLLQNLIDGVNIQIPGDELKEARAA